MNGPEILGLPPQERNINVWTDTHLPVGTDWREEVERALDLSDAIIAILNKNSYSSSSVRTECDYESLSWTLELFQMANLSNNLEYGYKEILGTWGFGFDPEKMS
jgi:hypothetical protein